jgi:hypothetical protein
MQVCCVSLLAAGISDVHTGRKTDPRPFTPTSPLYVDNRRYVQLVYSNFNREMQIISNGKARVIHFRSTAVDRIDVQDRFRSLRRPRLYSAREGLQRHDLAACPTYIMIRV